MVTSPVSGNLEIKFSIFVRNVYRNNTKNKEKAKIAFASNQIAKVSSVDPRTHDTHERVREMPLSGIEVLAQFSF